MHRIDGPGATVDNRFTDGDPVGGVQATMVTDDWANAVQEEIVAVISDPLVVPAIPLNKAANNQLVAAIKKLIAAAPDATTSAKGIARFGTVPEQLAGLLTTVMSNPAGVLALLAAWFPKRTFTTADFIRIPDVAGGLIIQWQKITHTAGKNVSQSFSFPTPFPVGCLAKAAIDSSTLASRPVIWSGDDALDTASSFNLNWTFGDVSSGTTIRGASIVSIGR